MGWGTASNPRSVATRAKHDRLLRGFGSCADGATGSSCWLGCTGCEGIPKRPCSSSRYCRDWDRQSYDGE